jgi:zinc protease
MSLSLPIVLTFLLGMTMTPYKAEGQDALDRSQRPGPGPLPRISLPAIQKTMLSNGLAVWLVERHELPIVAFNLIINAGAERDPLSTPGLSSMTAALVDEGTTSRSALEIADRLDYLGATLTIRSSFDGTFATLSTLRKHLDEALQVYGDVMTNPVFPQAEFDRQRKQRLASLLQQKDQPGTIASLAFNRIAYGSQHPYGNDPSGTPRSLEALTRDDLLTFYRSYYRPNNATMIVVGDAPMKEIKARLENIFGGWTSAPIPSDTLSPVPPSRERHVYMVDKPGAAQSEIRIGAPALARSTPDYFPVTLMNRILGGQFSSRLNLNLREKRGFTYGARSAFSFTRQPGPFVASAAVTTAKTDSAINEFLYEIDLMHRDGATPQELDFVKKGLTGNFVLGFETNSQIAGALSTIALYGLSDDYYEHYVERLNAVDVADVKRVARRYLDSSRMNVVFVGDLSVVRKDVEKMGIGKTVLLDHEGGILAE